MEEVKKAKEEGKEEGREGEETNLPNWSMQGGSRKLIPALWRAFQNPIPSAFQALVAIDLTFLNKKQRKFLKN